MQPSGGAADNRGMTVLGRHGLLPLLPALVAFALARPALAQPLANRDSLVIRERLVGPKHHGRYAALEVGCDAKLRTPGTYEVDPVIQCACGPLVIPGTVYGAIHDLNAGASGAAAGSGRATVRSDTLGAVRFTVTFQGEDLVRLEADGPWTVCCRFLYLDRADSLMRHPPAGAWIESNLAARTRAWKRRKFAGR
jgi:hypothetical protein